MKLPILSLLLASLIVGSPEVTASRVGAQGPQGEVGPTGPEGPPGSAGPQGLDGPSIDGETISVTVSASTNNPSVDDNLQPFAVINYIIAITGTFPSSGRLEHAGDDRNDKPTNQGHRQLQVDPLLGQISMFAGTFAPSGWAFCDGQVLQISSNQALFSILETNYGGDGMVTFGLPDLRGRVPIHGGTGSGLSSRILGQQGGVETTSSDLTSFTGLVTSVV